MRGGEKGFKVVRRLGNSNVWMSAWAPENGIVHYPPGTLVTRKPGQGPLAAFETAEDAWTFLILAHMTGSIREEAGCQHYAIYEADVTLSEDEGLWVRSGDIARQYAPYAPPGTIFCEDITLREKIREFAPYCSKCNQPSL